MECCASASRSDVILPVPLAAPVHVAGHVRGHSIAVVAIGARFRRGASPYERFRRKPRQTPGSHIPGRGISGPIPQHRRTTIRGPRPRYSVARPSPLVHPSRMRIRNSLPRPSPLFASAARAPVCPPPAKAAPRRRSPCRRRSGHSSPNPCGRSHAHFPA